METHPCPIDEVLAAILRGEPEAARSVTTHGAEAIRARALEHDVLPLVADRLRACADLPREVRARFEADTHTAAAFDLEVEAELRRVVRAVAERRIAFLIVKGGHLAHTHYPRPDLRSRTDTDVLIARGSRDVVDEVLTRTLGYAAGAKLSGEFTATQMLYARMEGQTAVHLIDLHWRLASPQVFAHVLSFEDLWAASLPLPETGPPARVPCDVHALVIACMHRVAHHHDEAEQFKWLWDIHLIASRLDETQWRAFADLIVARGIAAVSTEGLARSAHWFRTPVPSWLAADRRVGASAGIERSAAYLDPRSQAARVLDDLRALPGWRARLQLAREHLFPPERYMRSVYAPGSTASLPVLYIARIVRGAGVWLR